MNWTFRPDSRGMKLKDFCQRRFGGERHANSKQFLENHLKSKNILLSPKKIVAILWGI
jgi:hypothetical protein